jgi:hypothetical protein
MSDLFLGKYDVTYSSVKPEELDISKLTTGEIRATLEATPDLKGSIIYKDNRATAEAALASGREYGDFSLKEKVASLLVVLASRHYIADRTKELREQAG